MAPTKDATRARIDSIKAELRSISTCTPATVAELQVLLTGKTEETTGKENIQAKGPQARSASAAGRKRPASKASTADASKRATVSLAPRERYILATETANSTLKSLADALKSQPSPQPTPKPKPIPIEDDRKPTSKRGAASKLASVPQRALQERSASQVNNSPRKPSGKRRSASCSSFLTPGPEPGLVATAECACVAFAYLGTSEAAKTVGKDSQELQLENGILALIGKLVAHGLDNLAVKELRSLKKRLEKIIENETEQPEKPRMGGKTESSQTASGEKDSLASLLDFGAVSKTSPTLPIVASFQSYVLRIIARLGRPRIVDVSFDHLKLSNPSSPANLIWHIAKSPGSQVKAARQLESLAQTILLLCPSISSSEDNNRLQPSPEIVFSLQHLALKVRQRWWKLAKHQRNIEKELLEPFSKCLVAFSRRSKLSPAKTYKLAECLYADILGSEAESGQSTKNSSPSAVTAAKALGSLAQSAGLSDEALRWLGSSGLSHSSEGSAARKAARAVRLATVSIDSSIKGASVSNLDVAIKNALEALAGSLSGSASELDSLFMEANALRRSATRLLASNQSQNVEEGSSFALYEQAIPMIAAGVHFCARFVGPELAADADIAAQARHQECITMASKFFKSILDSSLSCCKQMKMPGTQWKPLDAMLQDCIFMLNRFEAHFESEESTGHSLPDDIQGGFVKLSNAYWALHIQLRKANAESHLILAAMQRSTDTLKARPLTERESGLVTMKLERLAEIFDDSDKIEDCRNTLGSCMQNLIEGDGFQKMNGMAAKVPVRQIFEGDSPAGTIGRVLKSYHRTYTKTDVEQSDEAFFDDSGLSGSARGVILEWQLSLFLTALSRNRPWDTNLNFSVQKIAERLLHLYRPSQFPVRRRRLLVMLLHMAQAYPGILPENLIQACREQGFNDDIDSTEDAGLKRFNPHLQALLALKYSMQDPEPSSSTIRTSFATWESLLDTSKSWKDLIERVDDVDYWIQEIQATSDYLAAKGEEYTCLPVLHLVVRVLELEQHSDPSLLITNLCSLGLHFLRLGYSGKAGLAFAKAESLISSGSASTEAQLHWHLGYAEYLLSIGNSAKCESTLSSAKTIALGDARFMSLAKPSTALSGRMRYNRILADACYVYSLLSTNIGSHKDAAKYAKQSVVLNRRIWAALESRSICRKATPTEGNNADVEGLAKSSFDPLSSVRNEQGVPLIVSMTHDALSGSDFWSLIPSLYRALMQHSLVYSHQGLLQEAVYVAEQAEKVAMASRSRSLTIENASHRADYWSQSGRPEKAQAILDTIDTSKSTTHLSMARYYSSLARFHHVNHQFDKEISAYENLEKLLEDLVSPSYIQSIDSLATDVNALAVQMADVSLEEAKSKSAKATRIRKPTVRTTAKAAAKPAPVPRTRVAGRAAAKTTSKAAPKTNRRAVQAVASPTPSVTEQCLALERLRGDMIYRRVLCNLLLDNISKAAELIECAQTTFKDLEKNAMHLWASFKTILSQSLKQLAQDFTLNTLPESTIAFPAISVKDRKSSEGAPTKARGPATATKASRGKKQSKEDFVETLQHARERLVQAHALCASTGSTHTFQQVSMALGHVTVLLSAVLGGEMRGMSHPLYAAYLSEVPKSNSLMLAHESIEVEQENMSREECLSWPGSELSRRSLGTAVDFQKEYIDIIPKTWTAVSLAMNEDRDELYITRYDSGVTPFVLRLPIARHTSRDMDEEEFTFEDGRRDFDEIIDLSDFSTRSAKDMTTREARLQWWAEREALDSRLHELLVNMENIWLGGFKGVFSQHTRQPALLARFRKSFENILNRNLPSRNKKSQPKKPNLDPRILELFIGLGDATDEDLDLDEPLMDLVYFVVDILQFNGEHNAYDEIDFDAIVVETLDALRAYHSAAQAPTPSAAHTILILDKNLHCFPWESLPCLEKLSISRLPSLAALRERILAARPPGTVEDVEAGHYISTASGGTSILNPSGDLTHTSKTLKPRLDEMQGKWTHIANRGPSEKEFETSLRDKDLVLYFGHGSGAQFIRSKSIRRLYPGEQSGSDRKPGCATTLLFGCSSVHLSENGIYEPSGMLASYLAAGAPAVVGMLWDVTDKDCDRFAVKAGELWGLWPEKKEGDVEAPKTSKKAKGKGKAMQVAEEVEGARGTANGRRGRKDRAQIDSDSDQSEDAAKERCRGVGLDEAVRVARSACVLRYLNGAAAVVYGIPVYLE
ncbi:hypothetical protein BS50DRAFT_674716 [Corynespora cassiicola Philippines]|uniref:separase n=1 Tax=Corynespora cassiicola Philippines TaxID=1448308 RepID=A0A2T2NXZ5_CORCC|nr:hypothetical protein BS50DRAFT_674716 [Corynespora cassiicola Philippines]